MVSYNHEQYIAQAIESVIVQQTQYSFEIVISDDCSTDNTKNIIHEYTIKYPNLIKAHYQECNIGMGKNWLYVISECKGDYIALLEGDDYWLGSTKLQKQVNFLEQNKEFSICFNRVYEQTGTDKVISPLNPWNDESTFDIVNLASNNFMHTNSVIFRNNKLIDSLPIWFDRSPAVDFVVHMINAKNGLIKYLPDIFGVYRKFSGVWSTQTKISQIKKVVLVLDYLEQYDFNADVKLKLKSHKHALLNESYVIMLRDNNFSYIEDMKQFLEHDTSFVTMWMLQYYPDRIREILGSKMYRFVNVLKRIKFFLKW